MTDIVSSLRRRDFPQCATLALKHIASNPQGAAGGIPGLGESTEDIPEQLAREFIFCETKTSKKLNAIQELQLLELLIHFFQSEQNKDARQSVFKTLFGMPLDLQRKEILCKLISMAIGVKSSALLDCAAIWMQRVGCSTELVTSVVEGIIRDYCVLVPGASSTLHILPQLSQHFTCNLMAAVTCVYHPIARKYQKTTVPVPLLELLTEWIRNNPQLCLVSLTYAKSSYMEDTRSSLWTSPTKPNTQTPIPGLVRWCTQASLHSNATNNAPPVDTSEDNKREALWSKLHLAILQTLVVFPTIPGANQLELITLADMNRMVREVVTLVREATGEGDMNSMAIKLQESASLQLSIDRLVQVLQVALATGGFRCSLSDLQNICNSIPQNKLLDILQMHHLSRTPPAMHYEHR